MAMMLRLRRSFTSATDVPCGVGILLLRGLSGEALCLVNRELLRAQVPVDETDMSCGVGILLLR